MQVWSSFRDKRHAMGEELMWKTGATVGAEPIVVDPGRRSRRSWIWRRYDRRVLLRAEPVERCGARGDHARIIRAGRDGIQRVPTYVGASDYSRTLYSFDESSEPDEEMKHFSIDHDKDYILRFCGRRGE